MSALQLPLSLRLIQALFERPGSGRVFGSDDALVAGTEMGMSPSHVYKLLSEMSGDAGLLVRPRRGLYVMRPPLGGRDPVRPIAIAVGAVPGSVVAGQSALAHWDLIDQAPMHVETLVTTTPPTWRAGIEHRGRQTVWRIPGAAFQYRHVRGDEMFGISTVRLDSETEVPMFDRERTVLEQFAIAPAVGEELFAAHGEDLDRKRLHEYAKRVGGQALRGVQRVMSETLAAA